MIRRVGATLAAVMVATACGRAPEEAYSGYVEGEFVYLSAPQAGYLEEIARPRGTRVGAGDEVFRIGAEPDAQALAASRARHAAARSRAADLARPARRPEIAALEAQERAAASALELSTAQLDQQQALAARGFVSPARLDEYRAARTRDAATLDAARHQLAERRASIGREAAIRSARSEADAADAEAARQAWLLAQKAGRAPVAGEIADTFFRPGEWVAAGAPVASLLPDRGRRIRFFVPESQIAGLHPGDRVRVTCDGCAAPFDARVDFIAAEAEYTPPVIYSEQARDKLVFRVEAAPDPAAAASLRPGLPVDVRPGAGR